MRRVATHGLRIDSTIGIIRTDRDRTLCPFPADYCASSDDYRLEMLGQACSPLTQILVPS